MADHDRPYDGEEAAAEKSSPAVVPLLAHTARSVDGFLAGRWELGIEAELDLRASRELADGTVVLVPRDTIEHRIAMLILLGVLPPDSDRASLVGRIVPLRRVFVFENADDLAFRLPNIALVFGFELTPEMLAAIGNARNAQAYADAREHAEHSSETAGAEVVDMFAARREKQIAAGSARIAFRPALPADEREHPPVAFRPVDETAAGTPPQKPHTPVVFRPVADEKEPPTGPDAPKGRVRFRSVPPEKL